MEDFKTPDLVAEIERLEDYQPNEDDEDLSEGNDSDRTYKDYAEPENFISQDE